MCLRVMESFLEEEGSSEQSLWQIIMVHWGIIHSTVQGGDGGRSLLMCFLSFQPQYMCEAMLIDPGQAALRGGLVPRCHQHVCAGWD